MTTPRQIKATVTNVSSDGVEDAVVIARLADGSEVRQHVKLADAPTVGDEIKIAAETRDAT